MQSVNVGESLSSNICTHEYLVLVKHSLTTVFMQEI